MFINNFLNILSAHEELSSQPPKTIPLAIEAPIRLTPLSEPEWTQLKIFFLRQNEIRKRNGQETKNPRIFDSLKETMDNISHTTFHNYLARLILFNFAVGTLSLYEPLANLLTRVNLNVTLENLNLQPFISIYQSEYAPFTLLLQRVNQQALRDFETMGQIKPQQLYGSFNLSPAIQFIFSRYNDDVIIYLHPNDSPSFHKVLIPYGNKVLKRSAASFLMINNKLEIR